MPRVTVIIPTYNWSEVLPYSISSVLDQTFTDFELMVVGDCCTDDSEEVVARFEDPRVSWLNLPVNTRHQSGPNNEAIRRSDSELIAYLGHDDLWLPHHLEVLTAALAGTEGISHSSALFADPDKPLRAYPRGKWTFRREDWVPPTLLVHSRSLAEQVGGWRPPWETKMFGPETDLCRRMAAACRRQPRWVRDVTAVKLSAAYRADVYLTRPHHEQAMWLERIRAGETWSDMVNRPMFEPGTSSWIDHAPLVVRRAAINLGRESWRRRLRGQRPPPKLTAEQHWRQQRQFKGLNPDD